MHEGRGGAVRLIVCMYVHDEWEDGRIGLNMARLSRIESVRLSILLAFTYITSFVSR